MLRNGSISLKQESSAYTPLQGLTRVEEMTVLGKAAASLYALKTLKACKACKAYTVRPYLTSRRQHLLHNCSTQVQYGPVHQSG